MLKFFAPAYTFVPLFSACVGGITCLERERVFLYFRGFLMNIVQIKYWRQGETNTNVGDSITFEVFPTRGHFNNGHWRRPCSTFWWWSAKLHYHEVCTLPIGSIEVSFFVVFLSGFIFCRRRIRRSRRTTWRIVFCLQLICQLIGQVIPIFFELGDYFFNFAFLSSFLSSGISFRSGLEDDSSSLL